MTFPPTPPAGRYGGSTPSRRAVWIIASVTLVSFFGWVGWVFQTDPTSGIEWVAFESTTNGTSASVTFQISAPPGTPVTCAIRTVGSSMGTNGWDIRSYPASTEHTTQYSASIHAVNEISGVEVFRCWRHGV